MKIRDKKKKKKVLIKYVPLPRKKRRAVFAADLAGERTVQTTFRPQDDLMEDYVGLKQWCEENDSGFSAIINSFLPAIRYALLNMVFVDTESGRRYIRCDFGDVLLREPHQHFA